MGAIDRAVQQGNGDAAVAIGNGLGEVLVQGFIAAQRLQLAAVGGQAPGHLDHAVLKWRRPLDRQGKQIGAVQVADAEQIAQAPVDQQHDRGPPVLQQGIGGHRGTEPQLTDRRRWDRLGGRQLEQPGHGPHSGITRITGLGREHFAHPELPVRIQGHHIGEGAAPIDPDAPAACGGAGFSGSFQTEAAPRRPGP